MKDYLELLILAYFKEKKDDYSFQEIEDLIGINLTQLGDLLEKLIGEKYLKYENNLLKLSLKGRFVLLESELENYSMDSNNIEERFEEEKWELDKPYCPHEFSKEIWRNNHK